MPAVRFLAVLVACVVVGASGVAERADLAALDLEFRLLRQWLPREAAKEVMVVGIDEASVSALPEPITLWHRHLARFLVAMKEARPAAVGIDVVLPARSFEAVQPGADMLLTKSLVEARLAYPLVVALTFGPDGKQRPVHRPFLAAVGPEGAQHAYFPLERDGVIRRYQHPAFAGQIAGRLGVEPTGGYLDFARGSRFEVVSFHQVLGWDAERLQKTFAGKPVLLGVVIPFLDDHPAPVQLAAWDTGNGRVPGVLLHAQALRNMLGGELVQRLPSWTIALLAAAAALLLFAPWWAALIAVAGAFAVSLWALAHGWFLPPASLAFAALVPAATDLGLKLAERRRLRRSFRGYVSPGVMQEILAGRIQPGLAGVRRYVCVMFADIRGYTTRAQTMKPEEVIGFLNRYFERVVALVHGRGGTVVSIMGDGIMTAFGTPKPLDNPCQAAFDTARDMLAVAAELQIEIGIGLNAGEALCGHVGSRERHEYSAIGDVTNVASRLQSLTKEHGYRILAARAVAESLAERSELAPLGMAPVKGHAPVELFGYSRSTA